LAKLAKYYSVYVTDEEIIKFLDNFKDNKTNRNRFIIDLLRVAKRFQDEMRRALGMVEPQPLEMTMLREPEPLNQDQIIQAMNESLQKWKTRDK